MKMILNRKQLKKSFFALLKLTQLDSRLLRKIGKQNLLVILNFHQVSPHTNPFWNPLHPHIFEDLLVFLKHHFHIVLFRELSSDISKKPNVILSFDDGYYNFVEYAMPLLEKHGIAANMNIIPSCVESGLPPWNIQLYDFLNSAPRQLVNEIRLHGFNYRLNDESENSKIRYGLEISRFLKHRPRIERKELWKEITSVMEKAPEFQMTRMMTAHDIQKAAGRHEIGVHSFSHESMGFEDNLFFQDDFRKCFKYFREVLKLPLSIYAFPNGSYRHEQIDFLKKEKVKYIVLVDEKFALHNQQIFPRLTIYGDSFLEVMFRSLGYKNRNI